MLGVIFLTRDNNDSGSSSGDNQPLAAGCTLQRFPLLARTHIGENAKVDWNSWPPTSGPHYGAPAPFNFYEERINPRITLHDLEHGGIDIFYGNRVAPAQIAELRAFWRESPNAMLIAPMPRLDKNITVPTPIPNYADKIVASAWTANNYTSPDEAKGNGFLLTCSRFDEETFKAFRDIHRGKGPERFPVDQLTPGT